MHTLTCFQVPNGPLVHLEHRFYYQASPFHWKRYEFLEHHANRRTEAVLESGQVFDKDGVFVQAVPADTIPSYATFLILKKLAEGEHQGRRLHFLLDGNPAASPQKVNIHVDSEEIVSGVQGERVRAIPVTILVDGKPGNRHWLAEEKVVKSDWQGAESFHAKDLSETERDLDPTIASLVRNFA